MMLRVEGEAAGIRWLRELQEGKGGLGFHFIPENPNSGVQGQDLIRKDRNLQEWLYLLSLPFCRRECLSVPDRSVHTYVFLRVMALPGMLFYTKRERKRERKTERERVLGVWGCRTVKVLTVYLLTYSETLGPC